MVILIDFATPHYAEAVQLRNEVLRKPLGLNITSDPLEEEYNQFHLAKFDEGRVNGTVTLQETEEGLKLRQMAVYPNAQGRGYGRELVQAAEKTAQKIGARHLYCHARDTAIRFYESCGWTPVGEPFEEVGIAHQKMASTALT